MNDDILNADDGEESADIEASAGQVHEFKEAVRRGNLAKALIDSGLFDEYFENARKQLVEALIELDAKEDEERYRLSVAIQVLDKMRGFMRKVAEEGEFSEKQLRNLAKRQKRKGFF